MKITPAPQREVALYYPYYPAQRRTFLPLALGLYKTGGFDGLRKIEGPSKKEIPFVTSWSFKPLPSDLTVCKVDFFVNEANAMTYEFAFPNTEFIGYLVESVQNYSEIRPIELPQQFYRRLLGYS